MSRLISVLSAFAVLTSASFMLGTTPARAADDPVCLEDTEAGGIQCDFETLAQCQATLSGMAGTCAANGQRATMRTKAGPKGLPFNHTFRIKK